MKTIVSILFFLSSFAATSVLAGSNMAKTFRNHDLALSLTYTKNGMPLNDGRSDYVVDIAVALTELNVHAEGDIKVVIESKLYQMDDSQPSVVRIEQVMKNESDGRLIARFNSGFTTEVVQNMPYPIGSRTIAYSRQTIEILIAGVSIAKFPALL